VCRVSASTNYVLKGTDMNKLLLVLVVILAGVVLASPDPGQAAVVVVSGIVGALVVYYNARKMLISLATLAIVVVVALLIGKWVAAISRSYSVRSTYSSQEGGPVSFVKSFARNTQRRARIITGLLGRAAESQLSAEEVMGYLRENGPPEEWDDYVPFGPWKPDPDQFNQGMW